MKVIVLYHPQSEHSRAVEEFAHDFTRQHPDAKIELLSLESPDGSHFAELYDVMSYPTVMALRDDGELLKSWSDPVLPLMNEVAFYATQ